MKHTIARKVFSRIMILLIQPDFRHNPVRALWRRFLWRLHWISRPDRPVVLHDWWQGLKIALPKSACAAQVFYRKHSNYEIVRVMEETLKPGDVVVDIGAHIGEYTLVAAKFVGAEGQVHAIEPQPEAVEILALNARLNGLDNVRIHQLAIADTSGTLPFARNPHSWGGCLVHEGGNLLVRCSTLDEFVYQEKIRSVHLVKIDAAGNEGAVLKGGTALFTGDQAPLVICKLYHPEVVKERFGYDAKEIVELLYEWGYKLSILKDGQRSSITPEKLDRIFGKYTYGFPLLARRDT